MRAEGIAWISEGKSNGSLEVTQGLLLAAPHLAPEDRCGFLLYDMTCRENVYGDIRSDEDDLRVIGHAQKRHWSASLSHMGINSVEVMVRGAEVDVLVYHAAQFDWQIENAEAFLVRSSAGCLGGTQKHGERRVKLARSRRGRTGVEKDAGTKGKHCGGEHNHEVGLFREGPFIMKVVDNHGTFAY